MIKSQSKKLHILSLCLIFLINPYIRVIDILPDFIAFFIIAKMLERPSDSAPYFEEARSASVKLAWLSLLKIPAFILIVMIRSANTLDNDVYALSALIFATLEIILSVPLINNLFSALFYLGERGGATALISPFPVSKKRNLRPEDLRGYTLFFVVIKSVLSVIPELLLLTGTSEGGDIMPAPLSKFYPFTLIFSLAVVLTLGIIWYVRVKKYVCAINSEGNFDESLSALSRSSADKKYETKVLLRKINFALSLFAAASVFTFPLALTNTKNVNVFAGYIFAILSFFAVYKLKSVNRRQLIYLSVSCGLYSVFSLLSLIFSARFQLNYGYSALADNPLAKSAYIPVMIFAALEFAALAAYLVFLLSSLFTFIKAHTGIIKNSATPIESALHKEAKKKCTAYLVLAIILGALKCVNVFLNANVSLINSAVGSQIVVISVSALPWFSTLISFFAILFIGYSFHFTRYIKEECDMRYELE